MNDHLLVLDEGTTSTRAMLFLPDGTCVASEAAPLTQHYPGPGLVEHDAAEIWHKTLRVAGAMVAEAGGPARIAAIGIANQRETIVFWDKVTGEPLAPAIVWQDRRTAARCRRLRDAGHEPLVQARSGLLLDPYFSGSKIGWALEHWPAVAAARDRLAIGTVDSWLLWNLTGGDHLTDATNASRTQLMALDGGWNADLCALFGVPPAALPTIIDSAGALGTTRLFGGTIPITGVAGDQQAATIGQNCLAPGETKATFGTGAFVLAAAGDRPPTSSHRLLATVLCQQDGRRRYALEGSVFVAGSLMQWLRDGLGLLGDVTESAALAASVPDTGGVHLVPALSGLGAPWWEPDARAAMTGMTFATTRAHVVRAALEAMSHQAADLARVFAADGVNWAALRIDGGMVANDWMAQDLADVLGLAVDRPRFVETTALGAAMLTAVGAGLYPSLEAAAAMRGGVDRFTPAIAPDRREQRRAGWRTAAARVVAAAQSAPGVDSSL